MNNEALAALMVIVASNSGQILRIQELPRNTVVTFALPTEGHLFPLMSALRDSDVLNGILAPAYDDVEAHYSFSAFR